MSDSKRFNRPINHIAISCTDIEALVEWYTDILGFEVVGAIRHINRRDHRLQFTSTFVSYPETMRELKFAILTSANGVGIEVFQFIDPAPKPRDEAFEYARVGVFHICVTDPDPEALLEKVIAAGGKQVGGFMYYDRFSWPDQKGVYMQDPWGNVIEVMSLSLDRVASAARGMSWQDQKHKTEERVTNEKSSL